MMMVMTTMMAMTIMTTMTMMMMMTKMTMMMPIFLNRGQSGADAENSTEISAFVRLQLPTRPKYCIVMMRMRTMMRMMIMLVMMLNIWITG